MLRAGGGGLPEGTGTGIWAGGFSESTSQESRHHQPPLPVESAVEGEREWTSAETRLFKLRRGDGLH